MGDSKVFSKRSRGNLFKKNLARAELEGENCLLPKIYLDSSIHDELSDSMGRCFDNEVARKGCWFLDNEGSPQETVAAKWRL